MIGAYATRDVSGGHLNPAVTCACAVTDHPEPCAPGKAAAFVAAQTAGAFAAALRRASGIPLRYGLRGDVASTTSQPNVAAA
mmetsp:Transcript_21384/g.63982  ORF Transcript_21384/g.63982 Transcript_21384/m.63982 type:complete len:82 (-) Transcript_21384:195-440(-)